MFGAENWIDPGELCVFHGERKAHRLHPNAPLKSHQILSFLRRISRLRPDSKKVMMTPPHRATIPVIVLKPRSGTKTPQFAIGTFAQRINWGNIL
jgi:hypothetical protein